MLGAALLLTACSSGSENSPQAGPTSAPAQTARPAAPQTAAPQPSQSPAAVALAAAKRRTREEQKQFIADAILNGVFSQIELNDGIPRVYLKPAFRLLTSADKHLYLATVYAFAFPDGVGPGTATKVVVFDAVSGQEAGSFSVEGMLLK